MSSARLAVAWSSGSKSASSRDGSAVERQVALAALAFFFAEVPEPSPSERLGQAGQHLGGRSADRAAGELPAFQLDELPLQLRVARPQDLEQPLARVERQQECGAADLGVGVLGATAQRRLDGRLVEQPAPIEPDQGGPTDVGMLRGQRTQVRLGRSRVVGRFEAHDRRQADLGRLGVEGAGEPRQRLVVARRERLQRLHGQPADVGLLGLQRQVDRPEVGLAQVLAQAVERRDADRLIPMPEELLQQGRGPSVARKRPGARPPAGAGRGRRRTRPAAAIRSRARVSA